MRRLKNDIILAYKIFHDKLFDFASLFEFSIPTRSTRSSQIPKLNIPKHNLNVSKHFFVNRISNIFNSFPVRENWINQRYHVKAFKKILDSTDLSRYLKGAP